jgi:hypothetical protein
MNIIKIKSALNLTKCLTDQGYKLPSAAEYKAAKPIQDINRIRKISRKFNLKKLLKIIIILYP